MSLMPPAEVDTEVSAQENIYEGAFRAYTMDHESVAELVEEIRAGNAEAWDPLLTTFAGMMRATAVNSGLTGPDIDDAVQNATFALFRTIDRIEQPERLGGWLKTATQRESNKAKRTRVKLKLVFVEDPGDPSLYSDPLATTDPNSDAGEWQVVQTEYVEVIEKLLEGLSLEERAFIEALFEDAKPDYKAITAAFNIAIGTVGPKRQRLLKRLRRRAQEFSLDAKDVLH